MARYLIERDLPGAGKLTPDELTAISQKSVEVLSGMGGRAQWIHSFVSDDKLFCEYFADDPEAIREHGAAGGFPVTAIHKVHEKIDPTTATR